MKKRKLKSHHPRYLWKITQTHSRKTLSGSPHYGPFVLTTKRFHLNKMKKKNLSFLSLKAATVVCFVRLFETSEKNTVLAKRCLMSLHFSIVEKETNHNYFFTTKLIGCICDVRKPIMMTHYLLSSPESSSSFSFSSLVKNSDHFFNRSAFSSSVSSFL